MALHETNKKRQKSRLAPATTEGSRLDQLSDRVHAKVADLQERLRTRDAVIQSIVKDSCATLGPSLIGLFENFSTGLHTCSSKAFCTVSIGSWFHAVAAIDGITLRFLEGDASRDDGGPAKGEDIVDSSLDSEVIEL